MLSLSYHTTTNMIVSSRPPAARGGVPISLRSVVRDSLGALFHAPIIRDIYRAADILAYIGYYPATIRLLGASNISIIVPPTRSLLERALFDTYPETVDRFHNPVNCHRLIRHYLQTENNASSSPCTSITPCVVPSTRTGRLGEKL